MSECKCDKCGAEVCRHCGKACDETCDKARIDRLEREIEELKARPPVVVMPTVSVPFVQTPPYMSPPTVWITPPNPFISPTGPQWGPYTITYESGNISAPLMGTAIGGHSQ